MTKEDLLQRAGISSLHDKTFIGHILSVIIRRCNGFQKRHTEEVDQRGCGRTH